MRKTLAITVLGAACTVLFLSACNSSTSTDQSTSGDTSATEGHAEHGEHAHDAEVGSSDMQKMKAELAKLSPEDAASAEKQHFCPVSGKMLGTMGAPEKVEVNGEQVWICCDSCREELLANPDKYLAKLKEE